MKDDKRTNQTNQTEPIELTEARGLTNLRNLCIRFWEARTGKKLEVASMLKIGFLAKGTKSVKMDKGVEADVVLKPFETHDVTNEGEPLKLIVLNERLGLTQTREPADHTTRIERCVGAIMFALADLTIARDLSKKGTPIRTREYTRALEVAGFLKWNHPLNHAKDFIQSVASKVTFPVEAFELTDPPKKDEGRKVYKAEIRDENAKLISSVICPKSLFEGYRDKVSKLTITLISVDAAASNKANDLAKQAESDEQIKMDEAAKAAALAKVAEDVESLEAVELV